MRTRMLDAADEFLTTLAPILIPAAKAKDASTDCSKHEIDKGIAALRAATEKLFSLRALICFLYGTESKTYEHAKTLLDALFKAMESADDQRREDDLSYVNSF